MVKKLIFIFTFTLTPFPSFAAPTFGEAVESCLKKINNNELKCETAGCKSKQVENEVWPCLEAMNLKKASCVLHGYGLFCSTPIADSVFPNTRGCKIQIDYGVEQKFKATILPDLNKTCQIDDLTIDGTESKLLSSLQSDVTFATAKGKTTWQAPQPVIAYHFEKTVPMKDVIIESLYFIDEKPWIEATFDCTEPTFQYLCENFDTEKNCAHIQTRLRKKVGLEGHTDSFPQRHFVGRKGPKSFPIVSRFRLKKTTKLCAVNLPKGTVLTSAFDYPICNAMTDGAIRLDGFPISLFPLLQTAKTKKNTTVTCAPKALAASHMADMSRETSTGVPPPLNWQECNCHTADPQTGN